MEILYDQYQGLYSKIASGHEDKRANDIHVLKKIDQKYRMAFGH